MNPCNKCLENNWKYKYDDGLIIATCLNCDNEVSFEAKNSNARKIEKVGDLCRKCQSPVIFKESKFKKKKLLKQYYYTGYFRCLKCKTDYYSDEFKINNF